MRSKAANSINVSKFEKVSGFALPFENKKADAVICTSCMFVNDHTNHYCTNCGYPVQQNDADFKLYRLRSKQRTDLLRQMNTYIFRARVMLYVASAFFLASIGFLFSDSSNKYSLAFGGFVLSSLFFLLARWSVHKPFTALLTSFIVILTFCTITIFGEFVSSFSTVEGLYSIVTSMVMIYFLLKGVQAAYKSDLLKEEMEVY